MPADNGATQPAARQTDPRVGLCSTCAHGRQVMSAKGSVFWLCELAATDARFRKYPPLPVRQCDGYRAPPPP